MFGKDERGTIIIEASYCMCVVIICLALLLSLGMYMYQRAMFNTVANQIAEEIAMTYKFGDGVDNCSNIEKSDVTSVNSFRYWFWFENSLKATRKSKATAIAEQRLTASSFATSNGDINVTVESTSDDLGRAHYAVTLSRPYKFALGGFLSMLGQEDVQTLKTTVYVSGCDLSGYFSKFNMTKYFTGKLKKVFSVSDSFISAIHSGLEMIDGFLD